MESWLWLWSWTKRNAGVWDFLDLYKPGIGEVKTGNEDAESRVVCSVAGVHIPFIHHVWLGMWRVEWCEVVTLMGGSGARRWQCWKWQLAGSFYSRDIYVRNIRCASRVCRIYFIGFQFTPNFPEFGNTIENSVSKLQKMLPAGGGGG